MKSHARHFVASILGSQVRRLRKKNQFLIVAVAGSVGKTSTKFAIVQTLRQKYRVQHQEGNYNDLVSVPLVFFGQQMPSLFNPFSWLLVFIKNEFILLRNYPYEIVVVELGTDAPGQLQQFGKYLQADIGVLTAISPEHMEYFKDFDAVAREELVLTQLAKKLFVNKDLCPNKYLHDLPKGTVTYGLSEDADVRLTNLQFDGGGANFDIVWGQITFLHGRHEKITEPQFYSVCAAVCVAVELDLPTSAIDRGVRNIQPASGRMQQLEGINNSIIIDDTYNASPVAVIAALDTLYRIAAPQKIAILGNMNELGEYSPAEHQTVGEYCDPTKLSLVVTIGPDANKYLAPAAKSKGIKVESFDSPYDAGAYVKKLVQPGAVILAKGSQNGVFAEETVKQLLADPADSAQLVRQSKYWMKRKHKAFPSVKMG